MSDLNDVDLDRVAQLYLDSSDAQHGDIELARFEAELWLSLFREAVSDEVES